MSTKRSPFDSLESPALLQEQVYQQIRYLLITGQLSPGQRLVIRTLADSMGTSPMPVRDALQRLAAQGVLSGKRTLCVPELSDQDIHDILSIRLELELLAVERVIERATDPELKTLEQAFKALERSTAHNNPHEFLQANAHFHLTIASLAHSQMLVNTLEPLWLRMGPTIKLLPHERANLQAVLPVHKRILDALKVRDLAAARQAIRDDLLNTHQKQPLGT